MCKLSLSTGVRGLLNLFATIAIKTLNGQLKDLNHRLLELIILPKIPFSSEILTLFSDSFNKAKLVNSIVTHLKDKG